MRIFLLIVAITCILGIGSIFLIEPTPEPEPIGFKENHQPPPVHAGSKSTQNPLSPMAQTLQDPNGTVERDLMALGNIFRYYLLEPAGQIPTGTNQEITKALTLPNEMGLPHIPSDHSAINADGELTDRWGKPYFFHALSSQHIEIRSAGPDGAMYTADDLLWPEESESHQRHHTEAIDLKL